MTKLHQSLLVLAALGGVGSALLTLWGQAHYVSRDEYGMEQKANIQAHQTIAASLEEVRRSTAILLDRAERKFPN
jgi:hypothetical protein